MPRRRPARRGISPGPSGSHGQSMRAAPLVPARSGTATPPGGAAPAGTRTASAVAAAAPRGCRAGTSRMAGPARARTVRCSRRSNPRTSPSDPWLPLSTPSLSFTGPSQAGHSKARSNAPRNADLRKTLGLRDFPANTLQSDENDPDCGVPTPERRRFSSAPAREGLTLVRILVTGASGYVGAALVPRLQQAGHEVRGFARSRERVAAAGVALDDLVVGDAISGAGLARALDGADAAYYLIHSMEGPGRDVPGARAARRRALRHRRARRRRAPRRLPRRARAARRRGRLAPPRLAARGRGGADRRGRRGDRLPGVDRDRRPLALVPLPRAADRAPAGAGPARVAHEPHAPDRRPRRARVPRPRGRRAGRAGRPLVGHRRAGDDDLRGADRPHRRRDARRPPRRSSSASR